MFGNLKVGADTEQISDLLEILAKHINQLSKEIRKYGKTGEKEPVKRGI